MEDDGFNHSSDFVRVGVKSGVCSGLSYDLKFDKEKFKKFANKIIYLVYEENSKEIEEVFPKDNNDEKSRKYILNAALRENGQRNFIMKGLIYQKKY